jgi:hypothetical protein
VYHKIGSAASHRQSHAVLFSSSAEYCNYIAARQPGHNGTKQRRSSALSFTVRGHPRPSPRQGCCRRGEGRRYQLPAAIARSSATTTNFGNPPRGSVRVPVRLSLTPRGHPDVGHPKMLYLDDEPDSGAEGCVRSLIYIGSGIHHVQGSKGPVAFRSGQSRQ